MNRSNRTEWNAARSFAIREAHRQQWERRAELVAQGRIDRACRFARNDEYHVCSDREGGPLRPGTTCWHEASAQIEDLSVAKRVLSVALEQTIDDWLQQVASQGYAVLGKPSQQTADAESRCNPRRLPQYRRVS